MNKDWKRTYIYISPGSHTNFKRDVFTNMFSYAVILKFCSWIKFYVGWLTQIVLYMSNVAFIIPILTQYRMQSLKFLKGIMIYFVWTKINLKGKSEVTYACIYWNYLLTFSEFRLGTCITANHLYNHGFLLIFTDLNKLLLLKTNTSLTVFFDSQE